MNNSKVNNAPIGITATGKIKTTVDTTLNKILYIYIKSYTFVYAFHMYKTLLKLEVHR